MGGNCDEREREIRRRNIKGRIKTSLKNVLLAHLCILLLSGAAHADELIMKNGDRLQGTVVLMEFGKMEFKTSYAGTITIKWEEIASLTTEEAFDAYLRDDKELVGRVTTNEEGALTLEPAKGAPSIPVAMSEVKTLVQHKPLATWEVSGNITAGASKETGNTDTEKYSLTGNMVIAKLPDVIRLYGEFYKEWADKELSKDNALGSATYERFLNKNWFAYANGLAQTDKFKDLDLLSNLGVGAGYQVWMTQNRNLSFRLGPAWGYEKYNVPQPYMDNNKSRNYFAGYWALDFDMWFFNRFLQLYHHDDFLYDFQESENWVVRTRTGVRIPMILKLYASFQFNYDWDNQPATGKHSYDQSWVFGLGWAF